MITIPSLIEKKKNSQKIVMLTAYEFALASLMDQCGVDIILVGDSLANVVLGLKDTKDATMDAMIHHAKAVRRGVTNALIIGDMPYEAYQKDPSKALMNAKRFMDEAGCQAVKIEWFEDCLPVAKELIAAGIPVMGHVGLTPQRSEELGGMKVQGKNAESAYKIIEYSQKLEQVGCFGVVLECIPREVARIITRKLSIPTIGIGAGVYCDGQVLVITDLLGLNTTGHKAKFVKSYADLNQIVKNAVTAYVDDVRSQTYPDQDHSYSFNLKEMYKLEVYEKLD